MSLRSSMAALIAVHLLAGGWAFAATPTTGAGMSAVNSTQIEVDHWYRVRRLTTLTPYAQVGLRANENSPTQKITLPPGTELNVMEISADGQYVQIGIDEDLSSQNPGLDSADPVVLWVKKSELMLTQPIYVDMAAIDMFEDMGIELDTTQEEQAWWDEAGLIGSVARKKKSSMTYCLRDVRITAAKYTAKKNIPQGIPRAAVAYGAYKAKGWKPIKLSNSCPNGTACFYGGGRMDCCTKTNKKGKCIARGACGHAAIKIGSNKWKGAGIRPVPGLPNKNGKVYVFQGCLTPP
jgi:hypothetical protein